MRDNTTFEHQAQPDLAARPPYRRLRAIGHTVGCACESCFIHVERAIERYLPGFFPADPMELRLREQDRVIAALRQEVARLSIGHKPSALREAR